jgi:hypothetical protein
MTLDENIVANWPELSGEYKVLQLEIKGKPYLRFSEDILDTHGIMMMRLFDIKFDDDDKLTFLGSGGIMLPPPNTKQYKLVGAGSSRIDVQEKKAHFYGMSIGYSIEISFEHLEDIKKLVDWKIEYEQ